MNTAGLQGLYAISDYRMTDTKRLTTAVDAALRGGAAVIQYRDKSSDHQRRLEQAQQLAQLCRHYEALFIVNDDIELARLSGAHGVHLGRDDTGLEQARRQLGGHAIIGVSCYNDFALAREAAVAGADYVAFGSFYPSPVKPEAVRADIGLLQQAQALPCPVVSIGGITAANAGPLIETGADMIAVISDVFGQADIETAAYHISKQFDRTV
jgi:thiamine-phosphate pyrophosphorylase